MSGAADAGTVTLKAFRGGESRIDMDLSDGTRAEIRDASTGITEGKSVNPDSKSGKVAFHNTLTDAAWFFPASGYLAGGPNVVLSYIDQETRDGITVEHIRSSIVQTGQATVPVLQQLSARWISI